MADYDNFAKQYSDQMAENGDFHHKTSIDPYIYKIIGDPKGRIIYDLGCGNGYISRNLAKSGAKVFASDLSSELIKLAEEKSKGLDITYSVRDATDFSGFANDQFDVVVMNMVIHYIKNLDKLFAGIAKILKPHGKIAFSTSHFFKPLYPYSEWVKGKINGKDKLFIKTTNYLVNYSLKTKSLWDENTDLTVYSRPLNEIINTLSKHGLYINELYEPESVGFAKDFSEELQKSHHIPTFIIFGVVKNN